MASPGWYPDPSGQPNRFRFWDGQSWSQETTADPYNTPPPGQAPPQPSAPQPGAPQQPQQPPQQPGQYGAGEQPTQQSQLPQQGGWPQAQQTPQAQQGPQSQWAHDAGGQNWAPGPTGGGSDYGSGKNRAVMVVIGVVVVIALIIGGIFGAMALTGDDDDDKASDDKSSQSGDPSETDPSESGSESTDPSESGSESTDPSESGSESSDPSDRPSFGHACVAGDPLERSSKNGNGRVAGGGMSFKKPKGYKSGQFQGVFTFASDVGVVANQVEKNWVSTLAVGGLTKGDGYESAEEAADTVMNCMAASDEFYSGFQSRKDLIDEKGKVNGKPGWRIRSEIRIQYEGIKAEGDVADVIVVKLGKQKYGLFVGVAPIGDKKRIKLLDQTIGSLKASRQ